jgi:hypothetical protein
LPDCVKTPLMVRLGSPRAEEKPQNSITYPVALSLVEGFLRVFAQAAAQHDIRPDARIATQSLGEDENLPLPLFSKLIVTHNQAY